MNSDIVRYYFYKRDLDIKVCLTLTVFSTDDHLIRVTLDIKVADSIILPAFIFIIIILILIKDLVFIGKISAAGKL